MVLDFRNLPKTWKRIYYVLILEPWLTVDELTWATVPINYNRIMTEREDFTWPGAWREIEDEITDGRREYIRRKLRNLMDRGTVRRRERKNDWCGRNPHEYALTDLGRREVEKIARRDFIW